MLGVKFGWREGCLIDIVKPSGCSADSGHRGESVPAGRSRRRVRRKAMSATTSFQQQGSRVRLGSGASNHGASDRKQMMERVEVRAVHGTADAGVAAARGLYDPALDKDSCGVGFIADIKGRASHKIVADALTILLNLQHRGAVGADPRAGDGAGILVQIPHKFFVKKAAELGFSLPAQGAYAVGVLFMPNDNALRREIHDVFAEEIAHEGMH